MPPNNSLDSLSMEQPTSVHRWARIDRVCLMGERGRGREGERRKKGMAREIIIQMTNTITIIARVCVCVQCLSY